MNRLWMLTKVLLKTNLFVGNDNSKKKKSKFGTSLLLAFLLVFVIASLGLPIILTIDTILSVAPLEKILISLILPLAGITTIVFSVFSLVSVFYLSKDSEHLLPLPISGKDIMMSKFIVSLVNEYYILLMFILPCLVGVGIGIDAGIMYYVYTLIIFLLLPIIPSCLVALMILLITRFTGIVKNKDLFMYISMGIVLLFAIGYNFVIQEFIAIDPNNIGTTFGSLENEVIPYFNRIFPFYNSASNALINFNNINGIFSLITFISFNLFSLFIIYFIGDKLYLKALIDTRGSKKKKENLETIANFKKKSVFSMLLRKEWIVIKRTPIFMLNIVVIIFLMPIIMLMSFVIGYTSGGESLVIPDSSVIFSYVESSFVYLIVLVVGVFFTSFSVGGSTAISREGGNAWVMKAIPVSVFKQINVKVFFASILDLIGVLIVAIIPMIMFKIPLYYGLCVLIPLIIITFLINYFNIYLDLRKPKIKWSDESVAVKQNFNAFISIMFTLGVSCLFGITAYLFYKYNIEMNVIILSGIISLICGIILAIVICLFKKNDNKLLDNVD